MGADNKYAGDKSGGGAGLTPENKYAGDPPPAQDSEATTDSADEATPGQDSEIAPENKYAGDKTANDPGLTPENKYAGDPGD